MKNKTNNSNIDQGSMGGLIDKNLLLYDMFNNMENGIVVLDSKGNILHTNPAMVKLFGYEHGSLKTLEEWIDVAFPNANDRKKASALWNNDIKMKETAPERDFLITRKDGHKTWIRFHMTTATTGEIIVVGTDISDLKKTKDQLIQSTDHLRNSELLAQQFHKTFQNFVKACPLGIHMYEIKNKRLIFTGANPAANTILGADHSKFIGKEITEAFPPLIDTDIPKQYTQVALTGKRWDTEYFAYDDGEIRGVFDVHAFQTKPMHVAAMFEDVTEKRKTENTLRRLAAAVESTDESILITDAKGIIEYVNPRFERMTSYSSKEITGKHIGIIKSGKHSKEFYSKLWKKISIGKTWRGRFTNMKKDGTLFEEDAVISPVLGPDDKISHYVAVKRDVTYQTLLENEVRQSQKMAAIGQLANKVAHDFTNILVIILGNAQLALDNKRSRVEINSNLNEIISAANRISSFTAELLAFSSPSPLTLKKITLDKAILGVEELLQRTMSPDVELVINTEEKTEKVSVDPIQIEQSVMHLAINAVDSMPKGGKLEITIRNATDKEHLRLEGQQSSTPQEERDDVKYVVLSVRDTGSGIDAGIRNEIFNPFFSTKNNKNNPGLGLAVVFNIVNRHNGIIDVESIPNKGTEIKIFLPVCSTEKSKD